MSKRALTASGVLLCLLAGWRGQAQDAKTQYPSMAPLEQYLMERNAEIALARSAAPESISKDAGVDILTRTGYQKAVDGKNGFVCVVERSWMAPSDSPDFWNPKIRGPVCYNPPAARSMLPVDYKRAQLAIAGKSKAQMMDESKAAFANKELPALEPDAMSYMLSKDAYLTDAGDHNLAHLMFYTPPIEGAAWGADVPNSPVMLGFKATAAQPINVFIIPVGKWSDGTPAPPM
ncbi:MAG TPA: hypothetical protein VND65_17175 [Candidatus Binatia bacterium]|nr:hypothetical protein [Candidatus Binatia bacterium]